VSVEFRKGRGIKSMGSVHLLEAHFRSFILDSCPMSPDSPFTGC
jgi:hypothetical protein